MSVVDVRGPAGFLWWLARQLKGRVALGALFGSLWFVSLALTPYLISLAIDRGLHPRRPGVLLGWAAAILVLGVASAALGIMRHRSMTRLRLAAALRTADLIMTHATRLGAALPRRVTAGEVVTIGISDVWTIGRAMNVGGVGVAAVLACAVIAVLLFRTSPMLAAVVLVGVPVLAVIVGPLLGRTQRAGSRYRQRQGELNARLVDVLGGLRILNGLGGKQSHLDRYARESARLRDQGYRVGGPSSWIGALGEGLPVVFLAVVIWLAARLTAVGELTVGQLIAVYGYTAMLVIPVSVLIFCGFDVTHGLVAARRVTDFLRLPVEDPSGAAGPAVPATLRDPDSGVVAEPGRLTALAGDRPVHRAITTAVAHDVAGTLDRPVEWGGRNLSGGQRQRVRLARAVHADPEMLLTVEPTSAVDAHTEAAIAQRLVAARAGRGTVVATTSPVLLDRADVVHYLVAGRVAASGTHRALLAAQPGYRALVTRMVGDDA